MGNDERVTIDNCTLCHGVGTHRNGKYFFYAVSLSASAVIMFFQWPPTPALFEGVSNLCGRIGLSDLLGEAAVWTITAIPAIFGVAFFYAWLNFDRCPRCEGRRKVVISEETRRFVTVE